MISIEPMGNRVLVRIVDQEMTTASGIVLPDTAKEKPEEGIVEAVSEEDETRLHIGDKVLFDKYSGTEIKRNGQTYLILSQDDVLARLRD